MANQIERCVICEGDLDDRFGHNPAPVKNEGRCCGMCNAMIVIPARLQAMIEADERQENDNV